MNFLENINSRYSNDLYLTFFIKKSEKLVSAIYLITQPFYKKDPLGRNLRKKVLIFFSLSQNFYYCETTLKKELLKDLEIEISKIFSSLQLAHFVGLISSDNFEVFQRELNLLLSLLTNKEKDFVSDKFLLEGNYFKIKDKKISSAKIKNVLDKIKDKNNSKGQILKDNEENSVPISKGQKTSSPKKNEAREQRVERLKAILDKGQKMTIKDISKKITDCSEKTIQRDLSFMLEKGLLEKEGKRRWSKYKIVKSS